MELLVLAPMTGLQEREVLMRESDSWWGERKLADLFHIGLFILEYL